MMPAYIIVAWLLMYAMMNTEGWVFVMWLITSLLVLGLPAAWLLFTIGCCVVALYLDMFGNLKEKAGEAE